MAKAESRKAEIRLKADRYYRNIVIAVVCLVFGNSNLFAADADTNLFLLQPQALNFVGIYGLRDIDPNLTGATVKVGIVCRSYTYRGTEPQNDYTMPISHPCFANKKISLFDDGQTPAGISPHAAAVASILLGRDANGFSPKIGDFYYEGIVPDANADIYEFRHFVRDVIFPAKTINVDVLSMSLGSQFEDWWTRGIDRLAETSGIPIVAGAGNGTIVNDPVLYPAAGPNVLAVGVVDSISGPNDLMNLANFSLPSVRHSSRGPTQDGRCKPDIVAPGNCLAATTDVKLPYETTGNWSSFSTPVVAGTIGLLVQKAKSDPNLEMALAPAGNCVFKAIVMNSARKLPFWHKGDRATDNNHKTPLDYLQGAGMLDAAAAYEQLVAGKAADGNDTIQKFRGWDNNRITAADSHVYHFKIAPLPDNYIAATVVWNRHYQERYPFEAIPQRTSTLRLELWASDTNKPQNDRRLDYSDSPIDNVQHIYYPVDPNYTNYALVVSFVADDAADANTVERYGFAWDVKEDTQINTLLSYDLDGSGVVDGNDLAVLTDYIN